MAGLMSRLAARSLGLGLGRPLGEESRLPLAGPTQLLDEGSELLQFTTEFGALAGRPLGCPPGPEPELFRTLLAN